jgi:hypothetical protein
MRFFSSGWSDCRNVLIPMGSTSDDWSKRQRRTLFLLDRFVYATLGVEHPPSQGECECEGKFEIEMRVNYWTAEECRDFSLQWGGINRVE